MNIKQLEKENELLKLKFEMLKDHLRIMADVNEERQAGVDSDDYIRHSFYEGAQMIVKEVKKLID